MSPPAPTQGDGFCASRSSGPNATTYRSSTDSSRRSRGTSGNRARNSSTVIAPDAARAWSSRSRERRICTPRSGPRLELDHVAIGVAQVDRRPVAPGAEALDHVALERDALPAQRLGDRLEVVALDRQAEVIGPDRARLTGRQQVDQGLAEPEMDQRDPLVQLGERTTQDVLVEPALARMVANSQYHVIEAERRVHRHLHRGKTTTSRSFLAEHRQRRATEEPDSRQEADRERASRRQHYPQE